MPVDFLQKQVAVGKGRLAVRRQPSGIASSGRHTHYNQREKCRC
jgi:hypothetical protein